MRVLIAVSEGPHQGQVFRFEGHDVFLVGRSKKAHFRLPSKDEYFSRLHFLVEVNPPHCRLTDLGSANGTFINGQRVAAADLNDGDRIQAGQTVMHVRLERQQESSGLPTPQVRSPFTPSSVSPVNASLFKESVYAKGVPTVPCVVCASPAPSVASHNDPDKTVAMPWPLCVTCRERCSTIPQPFPDYLFLRRLGQGGMGVVHLALHVPQGRLVAVKSIASARENNAVEVQRFLREARILQHLQHPHIVAFHEMADFGGSFYFSMDFVEGEDCAALVKQHGPLSIARAVHLMAQTLEALDYAHQRGIVHRDIKPANLQVTTVAGQDVVKVLDFGLARAYQMSRFGGLTLKGEMGGTVPFMAPEQITNFRESQPAVDQYAAAATLYYLLTGHFIQDFPMNFHERLLMILEKPPVPLRERLPQAPPSLADAIHRALAYEPTSRFRDVAAFRTALLAVPL